MEATPEGRAVAWLLAAALGATVDRLLDAHDVQRLPLEDRIVLEAIVRRQVPASAAVRLLPA